MNDLELKTVREQSGTDDSTGSQTDERPNSGHDESQWVKMEIPELHKLQSGGIVR
jgi:hypothetical protein